MILQVVQKIGCFTAGSCCQEDSADNTKEKPNTKKAFTVTFSPQMKSLNQTLIMHTKAGALQCETKRLFCMRTTSQQELISEVGRVDFDVRFSQVKETDTARVKTAATTPNRDTNRHRSGAVPRFVEEHVRSPFRSISVGSSVPHSSLSVRADSARKKLCRGVDLVFLLLVRVFSDVAHCFRMVR